MLRESFTSVERFAARADKWAAESMCRLTAVVAKRAKKINRRSSLWVDRAVSWNDDLDDR